MTIHTLENLAVMAFWVPSGTEWIILLVIALLIFGRRLPDVGRWLGQGIVEFKKGIKGIEDDIDVASSDPKPKDQLDDQSAREPTGGVGSAHQQQGEKSQQNF